MLLSSLPGAYSLLFLLEGAADEAGPVTGAMEVFIHVAAAAPEQCFALVPNQHPLK